MWARASMATGRRRDAVVALTDGVASRRWRGAYCSTPSPRHDKGRARCAAPRVVVRRGAVAARARVRRQRRRHETSLSLLPQPPSSASTDAPQPIATWMLFWLLARARSPVFAARRLSAAIRRLLLASPAPAGPSSGAPGQMDGRGSPGWGQNTQDDFPLARPREELLCLLFGSVGEREWPEASVRD